jgi:hypothetical protein
VDFNFLNDQQVEDLQMLAEIIDEMARADGFANLDACLKKHPKRLQTYNRYATAALAAMRRVQGRLINQSLSESDES